MKKRLLVAIVAALLAATGALPAGAGSQETTDVLNQGGAGVMPRTEQLSIERGWSCCRRRRLWRRRPLLGVARG